MVLVAVTPRGVLPVWMYHAQEPPPDHALNMQLAGLTWPDLVFPIFLFTMGAAIPLALARRIDRGAAMLDIASGALVRAALLMFFALFRAHFDGAVSGIAPDRDRWLVALAGFGVLCGVFLRLPAQWSRARRLVVRVSAWAAAIALFAIVRYPDGSGFRPERIDIILVILAWCVVGATLIWMATRDSVLARLGVLTAFVAVRLTAWASDGWVNAVYSFDPVPWLGRFSYLDLLCIVIPGTIAGDMLLGTAWTSSVAIGEVVPQRAWRNRRVAILTMSLLTFVPVVVIGITGRQVFATAVAAALLWCLVSWLSRGGETQAEITAARLIQWGAFWLMLGLILEPLDGGTKKVPPTLGWLFQTAGLSAFLIVACILVIEHLRRPRWLQLLIDNGQNPMVGYVGLGMLILPLAGLTGLKEVVEARVPPSWGAFAWGVVLTLLVALSVSLFTRRRLLWRT